MGWKAVKDHYRIQHLVQVTSAGICIGSGYIHDILVIDAMTGVLVKRDRSPVNEPLVRYQEEMDADPARLEQLVAQEDSFDVSHVVYTYERDRIIECRCEDLGWPNVTHDGRMMYENTFSTDRSEVVAWALQNAEARVSNWADNVEEREGRAADARAYLDAARIQLASLREREAA